MVLATSAIMVRRFGNCSSLPHFLNCLCFQAVRQAITAARKDAGLTGFFRFDAPATPDVVQKACGLDDKQFAL